MAGKMRWIDEFSGLDGMNAELTKQWLLMADCSTPWRQRQETLGQRPSTLCSKKTCDHIFDDKMEVELSV